MAQKAADTGPATTKRSSSGAISAAVRRGVEEGTAKGRSMLARYKKEVLASETTGEVATLGGGMVAGVLEGGGQRYEAGKNADGTPMTLPTSIPAGVVAYVAGRWMKVPLLRKAAVGLVTGGVAIETAARVKANV